MSHKRVQLLIQEMLLQAVKKLPRNANLILHSDQGIIDELEKVINDYVRYYNEERIQLKLKLKGLSPIQYRKQSFK